jgi:branched-chain amino acid transport system ATP-binding protein
MLEIVDLHAAYGRVDVLAGINLSVATRSIVCLLGANGAGKTTTLNCISGMLRPTSGRILFEGQGILGARSSEIAARGIVQVPEGREIFPDMTVVDNLLVGAWVRRRDRSAAADLEHVYDCFPRLKERHRQLAGTLSGGEQQMLMIGRALMARPRLLLMDEPSLGLSPIMIATIFTVINRIHAEGVSILLVEQNAKLALDSSVYGYILENGEITHHGPSSNLVGDPSIREAYLGGL